MVTRCTLRSEIGSKTGPERQSGTKSETKSGPEQRDGAKSEPVLLLVFLTKGPARENVAAEIRARAVSDFVAVTLGFDHCSLRIILCILVLSVPAS